MRRIRPFFRLLAAAFALGAVPAGAAGLTPEALVAMARISEPTLSPDGTRVVYTLRETDLDANRGRTDLWLLDLGSDGEAPWRLTTHEENDSAARFSPDGNWLYFLSARSGSSQVWRLPLGGGDALPVTEIDIDVDGFVLAPDGRTLVFAASIRPECGADFECTAAERKALADSAAQGRRYDRLFIRHWDSWDNGERNALFAQPLDESGLPTGNVRFLTEDLEANVPSKPFGDMSEVAITPDSRRIAFAARIADREEAWSTNFDIYEMPLRGGRRNNLTADNAATDTQPLYSADGKTMFWLAMSRPGFEADRYRIMQRRVSGGDAREVTPYWDRSPASISLADRGRLYAIANDNGRRRLFEVDTDTGSVAPMTAFGWVNAAIAAPGGPIVVLDSLHRPADIYRIKAPENATYRLTDVNAERLSGMQFGVYEQFTFDGWNDEPVRGFVMQPVGAQPGKRYPIAFLIHGGPQGSFGDHFHYRWNPQTYAAQGYSVVFIDFHGSTGYGQAFTDSISGDWGGKPLVDLQLGLAAAIERYDWLDGERACALGASYGGYMVNWIAGNWPDRFDCLVNHDGIFDLRMMYYTTEELWFPEWEHGGPYFEAPNQHERHNPVAFVSNWQTPMLVIHGARDYRVPDTQGIAAFTALQRRGVESELLHYEHENHWVLTPANSVQWHESVFAWLERFLK